ncbi:MAG: DUF177 domain-containing protein [Candidatus Eremiobacteraeota bacterium]|nr:DUF177 domain-containing protein [Candidatus Eremiobacteraeota bacterium]
MATSHLLDIGPLLTGGRQSLRVDQAVPLEPFEGITFAAPAHVRLEIKRVDRLLGIAGEVEVEASGECSRCLTAVTMPMRVDVEEQLEASVPSKDDPFSESNVLSGDRLDVADLAKQVVCSAVPLRVLCGENCRGLCGVCGQNYNTGACSCTGDTSGQP